MSDMNMFDDYLGDDVEIVDSEVSSVDDDLSMGVEDEELPVTSKSSLPDSSFSFDFSKLNIPGIVSGDIGLTISRYAVDRVRFTVANKSLISIVSPQVVAIKCHYNKTLGSYLCFNGDCCSVDGGARVKYLLPVVVYDTDKNGRPVSSSIENKVLSVGKGTYEDIMTIHELSGDITSVDLLVVCKKEDYQEISLQQAGQCRWKKSSTLVNQVSEFWSKNMKHIYESVAREVSPEQFAESMGANVDIGPQSSDIDFGEIFK